jgi:tripartite-type tricarboxylate transporter receptor subunit TctC
VSLSAKLPYDPLKDFTPITMVANSPYVLVLYPGVPANDIKELIGLAKSKPGVLNYGSAGPASLAHLAGALFATLSGIQLTHVPYKSTAQSVVDLISGRLDMQFATIAPSLSNIRAGQLRALAVTGRKRVEALPEVPTMDEAGVAGYEATLWFALMAPAGLPDAIAARLNKEAGDILRSDDMKETLALQGFVPDPGTPDSLTAQIRSDIVKWRDVIAKAGIKAE